MVPLYTAQQMRELDRKTIEGLKLPGVVLMEHAGHKSALIIREELGQEIETVAVVCGKGNNGGDGYVIARWLMHWGYHVDVFSIAKPSELKGDAKINSSVFRKLYPKNFRGVKSGDELFRLIHGYDLIVDALLGTGLNSAARGLAAEAIEAINDADVGSVFSVDIPSGFHLILAP